MAKPNMQLSLALKDLLGLINLCFFEMRLSLDFLKKRTLGVTYVRTSLGQLVWDLACLFTSPDAEHL